LKIIDVLKNIRTKWWHSEVSQKFTCFNFFAVCCSFRNSNYFVCKYFVGCSFWNSKKCTG